MAQSRTRIGDRTEMDTDSRAQEAGSSLLVGGAVARAMGWQSFTTVAIPTHPDTRHAYGGGARPAERVCPLGRCDCDLQCPEPVRKLRPRCRADLPRPERRIPGGGRQQLLGHRVVCAGRRAGAIPQPPHRSPLYSRTASRIETFRGSSKWRASSSRSRRCRTSPKR